MSEAPIPDVEQFRHKLLAVAYRMLGTVADAEDAVQDAYLRYHQHATDINSPEGWLVRTTTRLCIDRLRTARREEYVGQWLPEPVPETWGGAGSDRAELTESLSMAFLVLLETLSPAERATYLLREVLGYEFDEIGEVLEKTPVNVRQIAARARKRLETRERRYAAPVGVADDLAAQFFAACRSGDAGAIEAMLAADVTLISDGGGKAFAAKEPVVGTRKVANLFAVVFRKLRPVSKLTLTTINGGLGAVFVTNGAPFEVITLATEGASVSRLYVTLNPDKLRLWSDAPAGAGTKRPLPWSKNANGTPPELREAEPGAAEGDVRD
ncbi:RNA polymerase sigma factor SigJ [Gemmata sp. JC673]|uniref:RNA polymerase sigma factor SigJ n=1 Tax=Gemmata algarum TaxID=2975278 RepID=A0ABU5EZL2_9BACT|nr:RNA polymerase sigma factor SigJ [Gemmata algarum]MDY3559950.1 RNA polymerase sigma factor SigJ [Gemmata algarum]